MDKRSSSLNLLYYPFRQRLVKGLEIAAKYNIPPRLFEAFRSWPRQDGLFAQGRTVAGNIVTRASAGESYHNYGIAGDVVMFINGKWTWEPIDQYKLLGPIMENVGLDWLGHKGDYPHYQLKGVPSIYKLKKIYETGGLEAVWFELDKTFGGDK
jgi:peptidoglycan L-alanyl-D-glutamate endopeptidase CwlK